MQMCPGRVYERSSVCAYVCVHMCVCACVCVYDQLNPVPVCIGAPKIFLSGGGWGADPEIMYI